MKNSQRRHLLKDTRDYSRQRNPEKFTDTFAGRIRSGYESETIPDRRI